MFEINAVRREKMSKGSLKCARQEGKIPSIMYGGEKSYSFFLNSKELKSFLNNESIRNTILILKIGSEEDSSNHVQAMIKDIQYDPITYKLMHIDFIEIIKGKKIIVSVPIKLIGEIECAKKGGILNHILDEITVQCLPMHMIKKVELDVSRLEVGQSIHIRDIKVNENIRIIDNPDDTIVTLTHKEAEQAVEEEGAVTEAPVSSSEPEKK